MNPLAQRLYVLAAAGSYQKVRDPLPYALAVGHILELPQAALPRSVRTRLLHLGLEVEDVPGLPERTEVYVRKPTSADQKVYHDQLTHSSLPRTPPQEQAVIRAIVQGTPHDFYLLGNDVTDFDAFEETHFPVWPPNNAKPMKEKSPEEEEPWHAGLRDLQKEMRNTMLWSTRYGGKVEIGVSVDHAEGLPEEAMESLQDTMEDLLPKGLADNLVWNGSQISFTVKMPSFKKHKRALFQALRAFDGQLEGAVSQSAKGRLIRKTRTALRSLFERNATILHVTGLYPAGRILQLDLASSLPGPGKGFGVLSYHARRKLHDKLVKTLQPLVQDATKGKLKVFSADELASDDGQYDFRLELSPADQVAALYTLAKDPDSGPTFVSLIEGVLKDDQIS